MARLYLHMYTFVGCRNGVPSAVLQKGPCFWFSSFTFLNFSSGPLCIPSYIYSFLVRSCSFLKYISFLTCAASAFSLIAGIHVCRMLKWCSEYCSAKGSILLVLIFCARRFSSFVPLGLRSGPL